RLVDEHRDELFVLGDVRQDALDREQPLEALDAIGLRLEDLGHAADVDAVEQPVFSELDRLLQADRPKDPECETGLSISRGASLKEKRAARRACAVGEKPGDVGEGTT